MDNVIDDLVRAAQRCERAKRRINSGAVDDFISRLSRACDEVARSWSGSNIGNHATIYLEGFQSARPGEIFDREWGTLGGYSSRTRGNWIFVNYDQVRDEILRRAKVGIDDLEPIIDAANSARYTFQEVKEELLPIFDALLSSGGDKVVSDAREEVGSLKMQFSASELARDEIPGGTYFTRDSLAMSEGLRAPHHVVFKAMLMEHFSCGNQAAELGKVARHVAKYLEQKHKMKGKSVAKTDGKIFIGHGGSSTWNQLKDFIRDRLGLDYDEFNRESAAGLTPKERLMAMLDSACFAFLVMTAEDVDAEGKMHARENVIHEVGLFQGRLTFERAIILLEEGCEQFSNIAGITQIRFSKGNIRAEFDQIRAVLEREKIIKR